METKVCYRCASAKELTEFPKHGPAKDGLNPACKACVYGQRKKDRQTDPKSRARAAWHDINKRVARQKEYAHVEVRITRPEFMVWATAAFDKWFTEFPDIRPSVDREDPDGHYELGNIQVISLSENCKRRRNNHAWRAPENKHWCGGCKDYLDKNKFEKNGHNATGLQDRCKTCRKQDRIKYKKSPPK